MIKRVTWASIAALCCCIETPQVNAEPLVFIVSYHNIDYAKNACDHVLSMEPDAAKTVRDRQKIWLGRSDGRNDEKYPSWSCRMQIRS